MGSDVFEELKKGCHVAFDHEVSWKQNMRIVALVALLSHNKSLAKSFLMQCAKDCSTLRVSSKLGKPPPRIVIDMASKTTTSRIS